MDHDPYRTPTEPEWEPIARRSRVGTVATLVLAVGGLSTPWIAMRSGENLLPYLFVLALMAFPLGFVSLGRGIHELFLPISVELGEAGIRLVWAEKVPFAPALRRHEREIAWTELRGVRTHTYSVNGISTTTLLLETPDGTVRVPTGGFDRSAEWIQGAILDGVDRAADRPTVPPSVFAEVCRVRFAEPMRMKARVAGTLGTAAFLLGLSGLPLWLAVDIPSATVYTLAGGALLLFGGLAILVVRHWYLQRVLELRADGLALGPSAERARVLPWEAITKVRRSVVNGRTRGIEIRRADGTTLTLSETYDRDLDVIARLIDPEDPLVVALGEAFASGMPLDQALEHAARHRRP